MNNWVGIERGKERRNVLCGNECENVSNGTHTHRALESTWLRIEELLQSEKTLSHQLLCYGLFHIQYG